VRKRPHLPPSPLLELTDKPPLEPTVISLVIVNIDTIEPSTYASAFDAAGMTSNVYQPAGAVTSVDAWPTLGSMIESGGRMVVFMDYSADFNSVGWIIDGGFTRGGMKCRTGDDREARR
jgi:hypothetical protein